MTQSAGQQDNALQYFDDVAGVIRQTLQISEERSLTVDTPLLGAMPEFDSAAVQTVILALEDQFGFIVDEDDLSAELFETVGTLLAYVQGVIDA